MLIYRDFRDIAKSLLEITQRVLPATSLEFHARLDKQRVLHLSPESRYRGVEEAEPPAAVARILDLDHKQWSELNATSAAEFTLAGDSSNDSLILMLPLFSPAKGTAQAVAIIHLAESTTANDALRQVIEQMSVPLQVAVEREVIYRQLDLERQQIYERSIRDPLTGLFTRIYMQEVVQRWCDIQDRSSDSQVGVLMLDIDHFKRVNDTYGHNQGDVVLQRVAAEILENVRSSDIAVRLGGEEFAIFVVGEAMMNVTQFAERLRAQIATLRFTAPMADHPITVSIGVAIRQPQEALLDLIQRADTVLYDAKRGGRNRVCVAPETVESLPAA
jgi:diguanylate cyclase (GGDEF)-like protein